MTAEQKVKEVYPEAFCLRGGPRIYWLVLREGYKGSFVPRAFTPREAWAEAWKRIQAERKAAK